MNISIVFLCVYNGTFFEIYSFRGRNVKKRSGTYNKRRDELADIRFDNEKFRVRIKRDCIFFMSLLFL